MQIINTHQANNQLRTLLNVIQEGNTITVTRDNRNVAIYYRRVIFNY
jgi:antitoxin (DNA-binding transcriptional repressor) of toxin-antitoxin stability system